MKNNNTKKNVKQQKNSWMTYFWCTKKEKVYWIALFGQWLEITLEFQMFVCLGSFSPLFNISWHRHLKNLTWFYMESKFFVAFLCVMLIKVLMALQIRALSSLGSCELIRGSVGVFSVLLRSFRGKVSILGSVSQKGQVTP